MMMMMVIMIIFWHLCPFYMFRPLQSHQQGVYVKKYTSQQILFKMPVYGVEYDIVHTSRSHAEFAVLVCFCVYLPDDDLVEVETCRRDINGKLLLFIIIYLDFFGPNTV